MAELSTLARPYAKAAFEYAREHLRRNGDGDWEKAVAEIAEKRFIDSVFDDRLLRIMADLCEDVHDSRLFIATIDELSRMVATPSFIHSNDHKPGL